MEARLNKNSKRFFKNVFTSTFGREETAETVVPDVLPDVAAILSVDGVIMLKSKEVQEGRISLSASIACTVVYEPEGETGVRSLSLSIPFESSSEAPELDPDSRPVAMLELANLDARLLNPRKVLVRADVSVKLDCYAESEFFAYDSLSEPAEAAIQLKTESCTMSLVTGVREKTFVLSDEYPLPASKPAFGELLRQSIALVASDAKMVGSKLVIKGEAAISLLYSSPGSNEPAAVDFVTAYSQIIELDSGCTEPEAVISVMATAVYFDAVPNAQGGKTLCMELHAVAQCVCTETVESNYLADAYCNSFALELHGESLRHESILRRVSLRETLRETLTTPEPGREVISVCALAGRPATDAEGISVPVRVNVMYYSESGKICAVSGRGAVRAVLEAGEGAFVRVLSCRAAEAYAVPTGEGMELRVPVDIELLVTVEKTAYMLDAISWDESAPLDRSQLPSVVLMRPKGVPLWTLAKAHSSTVALIMEANALEDGDAITDGSLVMIPRARA